MTKYQLMQLLFADKPVYEVFHDANGKMHRGILTSIQREDGSGNCFNVTIWQAGSTFTFFMRTED